EAPAQSSEVLRLEPAPAPIHPEDLVRRVAEEEPAVPYRDPSLLDGHHLAIETREVLHRTRSSRDERPAQGTRQPIPCQDKLPAARRAMSPAGRTPGPVTAIGRASPAAGAGSSVAGSRPRLPARWGPAGADPGRRS